MSLRAAQTLALCFILAACIPQSGSQGSAGPAPVPVDVAEARVGELDDTWTLLGDVRPLEHAALAAQAAGEVRRVEVREGAMVSQGDLLLEVDRALAKARLDGARAQVDEAKVDVDLARIDLGRLQELPGGVAAASEVDAARASVAGAEARVRNLQARVDELSVEYVRHEVRAPFAGVIVARYRDTGDYVFSGDIVLELVSLEQLEVVVDGPVELLGAVEAGRQASLVGKDVLMAEVLAVVPVLDARTRTVRVRLKPDEPRPWLVPGGTVGVQLPVSRSEDGVVVPRDALVRGAAGTHLMRVAEGRAVRVDVTVLATNDTEVLVSGKGVEPGDVVVTKGNERLRAQQPVQIRER